LFVHKVILDDCDAKDRGEYRQAAGVSRAAAFEKLAEQVAAITG
jgi:hypothetical protein